MPNTLALTDDCAELMDLICRTGLQEFCFGCDVQEICFEGNLHCTIRKSDTLLCKNFAVLKEIFAVSQKEIFFKSGNLILLQEICGVKKFDGFAGNLRWKEIFLALFSLSKTTQLDAGNLRLSGNLTVCSYF